ncbi:hydroxymyristoyl-ACP dehydratase [Dokdonella sp.]|uniref:hydroxymyristoyl-ACP dehydratase n=1 Tax=Dokdonella sp. TaxID=2291710 RepID=UPI002F40606E
MTIRVRIEVDHPSLPGHFPGDPVVPGVVLLDRIAAAIERDGGTLRRIHSVKFLAPLRPGEDAALALQREGKRVRFRIERDGTSILGGEGELA